MEAKIGSIYLQWTNSSPCSSMWDAERCKNGPRLLTCITCCLKQHMHSSVKNTLTHLWSIRRLDAFYWLVCLQCKIYMPVVSCACVDVHVWRLNHQTIRQHAINILKTRQISMGIAGYLHLYWLGNVLGMKGCRIVWGKWRLSGYRELNSKTPRKSKRKDSFMGWP